MANITGVDPRSVKIGDTIKFSVRDYNDNVIYTGKVVAICDYQAARAYDDVIARHKSMQDTAPALGDISEYTFLVVECSDGVRRPYGFRTAGPARSTDPFSWFQHDKVSLVDIGNVWTIKIFNCTSDDLTMAIRILQSHGYSCMDVTE